MTTSCYAWSQVCEDSSNKKFLVSRLFDVAEGSTLEESSSNCIRLEWNKGIVGHVAATGQPLNIKNAYEVRIQAAFVSFLITRRGRRGRLGSLRRRAFCVCVLNQVLCLLRGYLMAGADGALDLRGERADTEGQVGPLEDWSSPHKHTCAFDP